MAESGEQIVSPERKKRLLRIIHIEDQEEIRNFVSEMLAGYPADVKIVASFPSTEEAEAYLLKSIEKEEKLPDVIVSDNDLGSGKRSGVAFASWVRTQKRLSGIPFVLLTMDTPIPGSAVENAMKIEGVTGIVNKVSLNNLVTILQEITSSRSS